MTLPQLTPERLEQMICTACCCKQEAKCRTLYQRFLTAAHLKSRNFFYGLGASAVTASCLTAMWMMPVAPVSSDLNGSEITFSDYILSDMMEELS